MDMKLLGEALMAAGNVLINGVVEGEQSKPADTSIQTTQSEPKPKKLEAKPTPKRKRRTKAQIAADEASQAAEDKADAEADDFDEDDSFDEDAPEETPKVTEDMLRKKCVEVAKAQSKEVVYKILNKHGAAKLNVLKPEKYEAVYKELNA